MTIYILLLVIILVMALVLSQMKRLNKREEIFLIISGILLFIIMGFRSIQVGTDTEAYSRTFLKIASSSEVWSISDASVLYALYNKAVAILLGSNMQSIIIANSFFIILLICLALNKNSKNIYISVIYYILFYFYLHGFNIARQALAIALLFNAYVYIKERKFWRFLIFSVLATMIHNTAIIFSISTIPLYFMKPTLKNGIIYIGVGTALALLYDKILSLFLSIFPRYELYFTAKDIFFEAGQGRKIIITFIYLFFVIVGLYFVKIKKINNEEKREWFVLINIITIAVIVGIISLKSILVGRIELYFSTFAIIYIPMVIEKTGKWKYPIYLLSIIIMLIPFFVLLKGNSSGVVPYEFYGK